MNASRPRLIATDLDGTLLDPRGLVTDFTREVLSRVWESGVETLFVTARPPRWIDALADAVGGHGYAICANGAFLYDVNEREVVQSNLIDVEAVRAIVDDLRRAIPRVGFAVEHARGMHREHAYGPVDPRLAGRSATSGPFDAADVSALPGVGKLLARIPTDEGDDMPGSVRETAEGLAFIARVREIVGDRAVVNYSGACGLAEIGPSGVSKASALATWCDGRGITPGEVWAFGDMPNDIPMLTWAGRSFAVAGSPPEVREAATDTCGPNDADGVARALLRLLDRDG
ncbi:HAD family hydrolase [Mobilicoccus massiliensis]|uniref:HAD family hydrolase n=1 Tax=Mobilicoccus massiliensis TaxID=1522310 RepID=UPI00058FE0B0|nr:HAD family hydrolase [Mobilicoccus massiliensis]